MNTTFVLNQLDWYKEQLESLARYMSADNPNANAIEAIVTVLSLDGGARISNVIREIEENC